MSAVLGLWRAELALLGLWSDPNISDDVHRSGWSQQWVICQPEAWVEVELGMAGRRRPLGTGNQFPNGAGSADVHGRHD